IIRGPGSTLYGNNAFLAVINVITRTGAEVNGAEVSGSYGSFDAYNARFSYGRQTPGGVEYLFSGTFYDAAGHSKLRYPEFSAVNNGVAQNLDSERAIKFFGSISYRDFTLEGAIGDRFKEVPTAAYGSAFNVDPNNVTDIRSYVTLKYDHDF